MAKAIKSLYETIYEMVRKIPKGKVATYGQIARLCGFRGHARLVGYALHNLKPNSGVPWHRVINSKGMISLPQNTGAYELQKRLLERENIVFTGEKVDLSKYAPVASKRKVRR
jgi:methylated-DNA-protein-cysteine methyltransferase-like protein